MSPEDLAAAAKAAAGALGFGACGVTDLAPSDAAPALDAWLAAGRHGEMYYMRRQAATRREPQRVWSEARSAVVVLHNHFHRAGPPDRLHGRVARYATGEDYHELMSGKLRQLGQHLLSVARAGSFRVYVDKGPLPERELARRAGLGWYGKNAVLIHPRLGSFTSVGVLLTDLVLARDAPFVADRCGSCRRCLDACPTQALAAPRVLDARRCVAYLTVVARDAVPESLRQGVGDRLYGCDDCQEVCPWNVRFARDATEARARPRAANPWPTLEEIVQMTERGHAERFAGTTLGRAGRERLTRNAGVVLENLRLEGQVVPGATP